VTGLVWSNLAKLTSSASVPAEATQRTLIVLLPAGGGLAGDDWFDIFERQAIRRRVTTSASTPDPRHIDGWNDRAHPFVRATAAEQTLSKANRMKTSNADRW
jgi:hypothetical protein